MNKIGDLENDSYIIPPSIISYNESIDVNLPIKKEEGPPIIHLENGEQVGDMDMDLPHNFTTSKNKKEEQHTTNYVLDYVVSASKVTIYIYIYI